MLDGAANCNGAASEPMVAVLDGPLPGARLLRLAGALDEYAGEVDEHFGDATSDVRSVHLRAWISEHLYTEMLKLARSLGEDDDADTAHAAIEPAINNRVLAGDDEWAA